MSYEYRALEMALQAHAGQVYSSKSPVFKDEPYIEHPWRVYLRCTGIDRIVALLHDVLEDSVLFTAKDIEREFCLTVRLAVEDITRRTGEDYFAYIRRCGNNPISRRVKIADLTENLSRLPEGHVLAVRYIKALSILGA